MPIAFPFKLDERGRAANVSQEAYVREVIEQALFTAPGERVNEPNLGTTLKEFVFSAPGEEVMAAAKHIVHGALQQQVSDLAHIQDISVTTEDAFMIVTVKYTLVETGEEQIAEYELNVNEIVTSFQ